MRYVLTAATAGLLVLVFTATAPAQQYHGSYSGGSYYSQPNVYRPQPNYPSNIYAQPQYGGSFNYSTPSFGFGLGYNQGYGSNYGAYAQPRYVPNYYQSPPISSWQGQYHPNHHRYGHR